MAANTHCTRPPALTGADWNEGLELVEVRPYQPTSATWRSIEQTAVATIRPAIRRMRDAVDAMTQTLEGLR